MDFRRADGHEFGRDGPGVVVGHAVVWGEGDVVAGFDGFVGGEALGVALHDFLGEGLGSAGCWGWSVEEVGGGVGELGGEGIGGFCAVAWMGGG